MKEKTIIRFSVLLFWTFFWGLSILDKIIPDVHHLWVGKDFFALFIKFFGSLGLKDPIFATVALALISGLEVINFVFYLISFINFAKKIIDDVNFTFPLDIKKKPKFKYSFNKQIYSTHFYESIVVFTINRKKAVINTAIENQGTHHGIEDLVIRGNELNIQNLKKFTDKIDFISLRKITKYFRKIANDKIVKKFFD